MNTSPCSEQDAALRRTLSDATEVCGRPSLDEIPCQRPPGHSRMDGHRDSSETDATLVWDDDGR